MNGIIGRSGAGDERGTAFSDQPIYRLFIEDRETGQACDSKSIHLSCLSHDEDDLPNRGNENTFGETVGRRVVPIAYRKADREEEDAAWKRDRRAFNRSPASRAAVNLSFSIRRLVP